MRFSVASRLRPALFGVHVSKFRSHVAFTIIELVAIVALLVALFVLVFISVPRSRRQARERECVNNLKQVGLAFRQWSIDSADTFPMLRSTNVSGSRESATNGAIYFTFVVMSNELNTPKVLICPFDARRPATNFGSTFANSNLSYFIGVSAEETQPTMLLSGDRNLTNGPLPANRLLLLTTNSAPGWNQQIHKLRGNVGLSDGSVQGTSTPLLRTLVTNGGTDNLLAFP